ncbi:uncharacterized protein PAC_16658 [Phialocephala subalpina]|uniref:Uncharacterized protein n=1 Tax=Phialocephala subalpina TaxID=576137 RepID=A0A1L7XP60_9HELO|nr:uncharacterized protein PAC_16658 [Phialocephala subalpina]
MSTSSGLSLVSSSSLTVTGVSSTPTLNTCQIPANSSSSNGVQNGTTTWGCSPGYICSPGLPWYCDLWANPPPSSWLCDPSECQPVPNLTEIRWPVNETSYYPRIPGYFNLNPQAFGLSFGIFPTGECDRSICDLNIVAESRWNHARILLRTLQQLLPRASKEWQDVSTLRSSVEYLNLEWQQFAAYCQNGTWSVTNSSGSGGGTSVNSTASATSSTASAPDKTGTSSSNSANGSSTHNWIAGAVIAPVALVVIATVAFLALRRRQSKKKGLEYEPHDKAQLHGDDIKPKEAPPNEILEMHGIPVPLVEMDAGYVGAELHTKSSQVE